MPRRAIHAPQDRTRACRLSHAARDLGDELAPCYWVIDTQSFPISLQWLHDSPSNEAIVEQLRWHVPALANTPTCGFRPGVLPRFADQVLVDEPSYYFAIAASEDEALLAATLLADHIGDLSSPFLERLDDFADLFLCQVDGWWEFFTARADWHQLLRPTGGPIVASARCLRRALPHEPLEQSCPRPAGI